jgi:hypothetical protein
MLGCGGDTPPLGQVTGTVTLDGKPVDAAAIQFEPVSSGLPTAFGRTDSAGKYELWYSRGNKGASLGDALVRINTFQDAGEDSGQKKRPESIPSKYNLKTDLKVEVKRGAQTHNFDLKSGGEIIQPDVEAAARRSATGCG